MTPRARVLLLFAIALATLVIGLTTMPQRARAQDDPKFVLMILTEVGWLRYVTPKGYSALPQARHACEIDRLSAANLQQGFKLECRPAR